MSGWYSLQTATFTEWATLLQFCRPRTQRRTISDGQENTPGPAADQPTSREEKVTPSRLSCLTELQDELSCAVCLEICVRPCATPCGKQLIVAQATSFQQATARLTPPYSANSRHCADTVCTHWIPLLLFDLRHGATYSLCCLCRPCILQGLPAPSPTGQEAMSQVQSKPATSIK